MESELKFVHVRKNTEFYRIWYCKFQFLLSKTCDLAKSQDHWYRNSYYSVKITLKQNFTGLTLIVVIKEKISTGFVRALKAAWTLIIT